MGKEFGASLFTVLSMKETTKISVITVCYNSAQTIERALQSVADQDWPHVEHIVIDGGSTDGTLDVIERFRPGLACVVSEPDEGIYDAMNKGLACVTGDVVCFLNADDHYVSANVLSRIVYEIKTCNLDAVFADVAFFHPNNPKRFIRRYRSGIFKPERLGWGWMPAHPALFLKKNVIDRVGKFKVNYKIAGDFDYVARVFHRANLSYRYVPDVVVHMRSGGISNSGIRSKIILNREVLRSCRENGIDTNVFKILSKYFFKIMELF